MAEPLLERAKRAVKVLWGKSDCVKLIRYQAVNWEFGGVTGTAAGVSIAVGTLRAAHTELVAPTQYAQALDDMQFNLCLERDQYSADSPTREWINRQRLAAMGAILYFGIALQAFEADPEAGRPHLTEATEAIKKLARALARGPPKTGAPYSFKKGWTSQEAVKRESIPVESFDILGVPQATKREVDSVLDTLDLDPTEFY